MSDIPALISELRRLRESSEKLLDLNFGFMEQNRALREENAAMEATLAGLRVAGRNSGDRSPDGTNRLCVALYGHEEVPKWLGGANAQFLHDAADTITGLREENVAATARALAKLRTQQVADVEAERDALREENARLKYQVEEAHCPCDHTVMYANGRRSCDSCPWTVPAPPEVK